jgi:2-polyprenyl-6-methoxyphenol hydroxylase-like FAD-dependent oxidoreductase
VPPWKTRNVTLQGDALHNMPPYRGVGANATLWDAMLLRQTVIAVDGGGQPLLLACSFAAASLLAAKNSLLSTRQFAAFRPAATLSDPY